MTDASNMGVEAVALALANYDAAQVDAPLVDSIDGFRFDADRNDYLARARAAIAAMPAASEAQAVATTCSCRLPVWVKNPMYHAGTCSLYAHPAPSDQEKLEGWQPIETAPKDGWGAPLLTCCIGEPVAWFGHEPVAWYSEPPSTAYWNEHADCWTPCQRPHDAWEPTHWRPVPGAPVACVDQAA